MKKSGEAAFRPLPTPGLDPDQSCFGCLFLSILLAAAFAFWGYIYWLKNPEFHPNPTPSPRAASPRPRPR